MADLKISAATLNPAPAGTDNFATDKAGVDFRTTLAQIIAAVAAGDVFKVGTPLVDQIGVWTGDGTIKGFAGFEFDGSQLLLPNYSFPAADGSADQVLSTDGLGVVSFKDQIAGGGLLSGQYKFSTSIVAADPGAGLFRYDSATPASVTEIYINDVTSNGVDISNLLALITTDDRLYIQSESDPSQFLVFNVTAPITDNTGWFTITGTVEASGALHTSNTKCLFVLQIGGAASGGGDVFKVGTPSNNQIGVWTGDGTIEGTSGIAWNGSTFTTTGEIEIQTGGGNYRFQATSRPTLVNEVGSLTNPTLIPYAFDLTTGVGGNGLGVLSLIASSVELARISALSDAFFKSGTDPAADGGILSLLSGASGVGATGDGGAINIFAGASVATAGDGGGVDVKGGAGFFTGKGGDIHHEVGSGGAAGPGTSGNYFVNTLVGLTADAGLHVPIPGLTAIYGLSRSGAGVAGNLELWAGYAAGSGAGSIGGDLLLFGGGQGGGAGEGGNAHLYGGESDTQPGFAEVEGGVATVAGPGGAAKVVGGAGFGAGNNFGGTASLIGGEGVGTGGGGPVFIRGGEGAPGLPAIGGDVFIFGGRSFSTDTDGGAVRIEGGTPNGAGEFGAISLDVGGTNIIYDPATDRLIQGAEIFAFQSELPVASFPEYLFRASDFDNPNSADWDINVLAPAAADSNNAALTVRRFDDAVAEGVGMLFQLPATATSLTFQTLSRAETAPGGAVVVKPRIHIRTIADDTAVPGPPNTQLSLSDIDIPTNEFFQYDSQTITFAFLSLTAGDYVQIEYSRNPTHPNDDLVGDWDLLSLRVSFT